MLIMLALLGVDVWGQGFIKSYSIQNTAISNGMDIITNDSLYVFLRNFVPSIGNHPGADIIGTNTEGVKQWNSRLESDTVMFNPGYNMIIENNDNYIFSGNLGYPGYLIQVFFAKLNPQENNFQVKEYVNLNLFQIWSGFAIYNDTLITCVSYGDANPTTYFNMKILKMLPDLSIIDSIYLNNVAGYAINSSNFLFSNDSGHIYMPILCRNFEYYKYLVIRKMDLQGNTIWEYPLNTYTTATNTPIQIVTLPNGNIVAHWFDEGMGDINDQRNPYLICLTPNGQFIWRYNFDDGAYKKYPIQIKLAANGDIIGCGYASNPNYNYDCGWLFRISPQGTLLWEREYVSPTSSINFFLAEAIDDDDEGNLVVIGAFIDTLSTGGYQGNTFLQKVLPNGCFTPDCNGGAEDTLIIASTVVGVESPPKPPQALGVGQLAVFPNPTNDVLQILLPTRRLQAQVQVIDMQGRTLQSVSVPPDYSGRYFSISTHDLPSGAYLVSYVSEGKIVGTAKVVVQH